LMLMVEFAALALLRSQAFNLVATRRVICVVHTQHQLSAIQRLRARNSPMVL